MKFDNIDLAAADRAPRSLGDVATLFGTVSDDPVIASDNTQVRLHAISNVDGWGNAGSAATGSVAATFRMLHESRDGQRGLGTLALVSHELDENTFSVHADATRTGLLTDDTFNANLAERIDAVTHHFAERGASTNSDGALTCALLDIGWDVDENERPEMFLSLLGSGMMESVLNAASSKELMATPDDVVSAIRVATDQLNRLAATAMLRSRGVELAAPFVAVSEAGTLDLAPGCGVSRDDLADAAIELPTSAFRNLSTFMGVTPLPLGAAVMSRLDAPVQAHGVAPQRPGNRDSDW